MRRLFTNIIMNFDRSFSGKSRNQVAWLTSVTIITIGLLYSAALLFNIQAPGEFHEEQENNLLRFIVTLFLDPGTSNKSSLIDRWFTIATSICGITLFSGVLISVISNILERRVERYKTGDIRYHLSDHIVIIGFDNATVSLVTQICNTPKYNRKHILIQSVESTEVVRDKIHEKLDDKQERRIVIFHARRDSLEELELLNTHKCSEIFIIGEENECEHDFTNIDCLKILTDIHTKKHHNKSRIPTTVLFNEQSTFEILQLNDISKLWRNFFSFRPINYQQEWAKRVIVSKKHSYEEKFQTYPALYGEGIPYESDTQVHLVIVGMSRMGVSLAIEAAHVMHFPNFIRNKKLKTKITFIDQNAISEMNKFRQQHQHFFEVAPLYIRDFINEDGEIRQIHPTLEGETDFLDIEFTFINGHVESEEIRQLISEWSTSRTDRTSIAVCLSDSNTNINIGLHLPDVVYQKQIPIFIRQRTSGTLLNIVRDYTSDDKWNKYANIYPFGMYDNNYDIDKKELYAAQCTNYIYHYFNTHQQIPTSIATEEELIKLWEQNDIALQWSNYYHAHAIAPKLQALHFDRSTLYPSLTKEQIELIAETEHNRWNVEKLLIGYRKPSKKEVETIDKGILKKHLAHPDIKPYYQISEESKNYNRAIAAGIPLIANQILSLPQS